MKRIAAMVLALLVLWVGAVAGAQGELQRVFDDLGAVLLMENTNAALFEQALTAAASYAADGDENTLEEAKRICAESKRIIEGTASVASSLTEEDHAFMIQRQIDIADYKTFFDMQEYDSQDYIFNLDTLAPLLSGGAASQKLLSGFLDCTVPIQAANRRLMVLGVNDLFVGLSPEECAYFLENIVPTLPVIWQDGLPWVYDRDAIYQKADIVIIDMEESVDAYERFLNGEQLDQLENK